MSKPPRALSCRAWWTYSGTGRGERHEEHAVNVCDSEGCRTCQCRRFVFKEGKWVPNPKYKPSA